MSEILKKLKKNYFFEILCFIVVTLCISMIPYIEKNFIEAFTESRLNTKSAILLISAFAASVLIYLFFNYLTILLAFKSSALFEKEVRDRYFTCVLSRGTRSVSEDAKDESIQALTTEVNQLESDYIRPIICIIQCVLQIVTYIVFIYIFINAYIALLVGVLGAIGVLLSRSTKNDAAKKREYYLTSNSHYVGFIRQILSGLSIVRHNNIPFINSKNQEYTTDVSNKRVGYGKSKALLLSLNNVISYLAMLLFFICVVVLAYKGKITIAVAVVSFGYIDLVMEPISAVFDSIASFKTSEQLKIKFDALLASNQTATYCDNQVQTIGVRNLYFTVENRNILNDVSLMFDDQNQYLIHGSNGSGKSTLLKILSNNTSASAGNVIINGQPVVQNLFYNDIYYISQHPIVFPTSFAENVTVFGSYDIRQLDKFSFMKLSFMQRIIKCPDCQILSGGEMQMVSLCRALICGAKWIFMDESFSGVAESAEKDIICEIAEKGYHILYVTHGHQYRDVFSCVLDIDTKTLDNIH